MKTKTDSEWFSHSDRPNGDRSLNFGDRAPDDPGVYGHAVLDAWGRVKYLREADGRVIADDGEGAT